MANIFNRFAGFFGTRRVSRGGRARGRRMTYGRMRRGAYVRRGRFPQGRGRRQGGMLRNLLLGAGATYVGRRFFLARRRPV